MSVRAALIALVLAAPSFGQGTPERIPSVLPEGVDSSARPQFVASGADRLHVVWQDFRDGSWCIYYRQVQILTTGYTFPPGGDVRISTESTTDVVHAFDPKIIRSENKINVVWREFNVETRVERVMWSHLPATGMWMPPATLSGDLSYVHDLEFAGEGRNAMAAWIQRDETTDSDRAYYARSSSFGATWGAAAPLHSDDLDEDQASQYELVMAFGATTTGIAYTNDMGPELTDPIHPRVCFRKATGAGPLSAAEYVTTEVPGAGGFNILDVRLTISGSGTRVVAGWLRQSGATVDFRSNYSTNSGADFLAAEIPVSVDPGPDAAVGLFYTPELAGGAGDDVYAAFGYSEVVSFGPPIELDVSRLYIATLDETLSLWKAAAQVSDDGPAVFLPPLFRPQIAANGTDLLITWMQGEADYAADFDVLASWAPTGSSWPPAWDDQRVSVTGKVTVPGDPEARSAFQQALLHAGKGLIVWDDHRFWTKPGDPGTGLGAPTVFVNDVPLN